MTPRTFPVEVLIAAETGALLTCSVDEWLDYASHLLGRRVLTHDLGCAATMSEIRELTWDVLPDLALTMRGGSGRVSAFAFWRANNFPELSATNCGEAVAAFLAARPHIPRQVTVQRNTPGKVRDVGQVAEEAARGGKKVIIARIGS